MHNLGGQHDGFTEVIFAAAVTCRAFGIHIGYADATLVVGFKSGVCGDVIEYSAAHRVVVAQKMY